MFDLTRQEKIILLVLSGTFIAGSGLGAYQRAKNQVQLAVRPDQLQAQREKWDAIIEEQRYVNINSLKQEELSRLPGIGAVLAERIIADHKTQGPFKSKEELMRVKGIGRKKFEQIKDSIILE